jgi:hypothetical protein
MTSAHSTTSESPPSPPASSQILTIGRKLTDTEKMATPGQSWALRVLARTVVPYLGAALAFGGFVFTLVRTEPSIERVVITFGVVVSCVGLAYVLARLISWTVGRRS